MSAAIAVVGWDALRTHRVDLGGAVRFGVAPNDEAVAPPNIISSTALRDWASTIAPALEALEEVDWPDRTASQPSSAQPSTLPAQPPGNVLRPVRAASTPDQARR